MVDPCKCRYCGAPTDRPTVFSYTLQRIFNFIWDNPGCTMNDLEIHFYGRIRQTNTIAQHMSRLRAQLIGTGYQLVSRDLHTTDRRSIYEISKPTVESAHVSP